MYSSRDWYLRQDDERGDEVRQDASGIILTEVRQDVSGRRTMRRNLAWVSSKRQNRTTEQLHEVLVVVDERLH